MDIIYFYQINGKKYKKFKIVINMIILQVLFYVLSVKMDILLTIMNVNRDKILLINVYNMII